MATTLRSGAAAAAAATPVTSPAHNAAISYDSDFDNSGSRGGRRQMRTSLRNQPISANSPLKRRDSESSFTKSSAKRAGGFLSLRSSSNNLRRQEPTTPAHVEEGQYTTRYASSPEEEPIDLSEYQSRVPNLGPRTSNKLFSIKTAKKPKQRTEDKSASANAIKSARTGKKKRFQFLRKLFGLKN
jgi:hypothetical protein